MCKSQNQDTELQPQPPLPRALMLPFQAVLLHPSSFPPSPSTDNVKETHPHKIINFDTSKNIIPSQIHQPLNFYNASLQTVEVR